MSFHDWTVTALLALVFACVIAKLVSVAFYGCDGDDNMAKIDANKVVKVGEQVKFGEGLRVEGCKSKKTVKFVDHVVIRHVDQFEFEEEMNDTDEEIESTVSNDDDVCEKGSQTRKRMIADDKIEEVEILKHVDDHGERDGKYLVFSDEVIGVCGDSGDTVSNEKDLLNEALEGDFVVKKREDVLIDRPFSVEEGNVIVRGIDDLAVEEQSKNEEITGGNVKRGLVAGKTMNSEGISNMSDVQFVSDDAALGQKEEVRLGENVEGLNNWADERRVKEEVVAIDDEDDWEGIERTELERVFAEAVNYVECGVKGKDDQLAKLGSDVQINLYGLHKIAVEGYCHEPQPMALNFSARAKWNAWQKLGSMNPEVAMEEYIKLLTETVPDWVQHFYAEDVKQSSSESRMLDDADNKSSSQVIQPYVISRRPEGEDASIVAKLDIN